MIKASITTVKNELSGYIEKVKSGQRVLITDHRKAVAILEPVESIHWPEEIRSRIGTGEVKAPRRVLNLAKFKQLPAGVGASLTEAILEERRQGR
ncbi:MAG: type II toxin-antitoxin system prevent-host-death family antitoxin [Methylophilaceae bacterium]|nr:type II toxin-antitoxin system prevent-host-death family antitoxin [Methylophilaceae bacterium]